MVTPATLDFDRLNDSLSVTFDLRESPQKCSPFLRLFIVKANAPPELAGVRIDLILAPLAHPALHGAEPVPTQLLATAGVAPLAPDAVFAYRCTDALLTLRPSPTVLALRMPRFSPYIHTHTPSSTLSAVCADAPSGSRVWA